MIILSALVAQLVGRLGSDGFWERDYAILAHAEGVLYGTELGSVTLKINNQQRLGGPEP